MLSTEHDVCSSHLLAIVLCDGINRMRNYRKKMKAGRVAGVVAVCNGYPINRGGENSGFSRLSVLLILIEVY